MQIGGTAVPADEYRFSVRVPQEPRYGITLGGSSPFYAGETEAVKGLDLTC